MSRLPRSRQDSQLLGIVTGVVSVAALYFGRVVFIPFALALLFSVILTPIVSGLEKIKLPRLAAIFIVVLTLLGATSAIGWVTSQQFVDLSDQLPLYKQRLEQKIHFGRSVQSQRLAKLSDTVKELGNEIATAAPGSSTEQKKRTALPSLGSSTARPMAVTVVAPANPLGSIEFIFGPLANVAVVAVFTIFILIGREDLRDRFIKLAGGRRLNTMTRVMDETTQRINRYLLLQLVVNSAYGLVIGLGLYFLGIPNAALWGMTATVLRFVPYAGPPLAAVMPILLSLAVFPGWLHALATVSLYLILELVVGNVIEPVVYGSHVGLSPLAILVSAVFWTLIWGFPGLLLSTPLTVCLVVIGRYSPNLAFLNILLGDEPVLAAHAQYYQRLLATDQNEARQVLERYRKEHTLEQTYSSVLLPALGLSEQDRHRNELDDDSQAFIYQSTRELIEELGDSEESEGSTNSATDRLMNRATRAKVLCLAARDEADEVTAMVLCQLLEREGFDALSWPVSTPAELLLQVEALKPAVVCISALPPFAIEHARALYGKLRDRFAEIDIIVCFWQIEGDSQKVAGRFKLKGRDQVITTLAGVINRLREFLEEQAVGNSSQRLARLPLPPEDDFGSSEIDLSSARPRAVS